MTKDERGTQAHAPSGYGRIRARVESQRRTPGWKPSRVTNDLCERPTPSPTPSMSARRMTSVAMLHNMCLRLLPIQAGKYRSGNVRLPVAESSLGASLEWWTGDFVVNLLKMFFLGAGASHSGTSWVVSAIESRIEVWKVYNYNVMRISDVGYKNECGATKCEGSMGEGAKTGCKSRKATGCLSHFSWGPDAKIKVALIN